MNLPVQPVGRATLAVPFLPRRRRPPAGGAQEAAAQQTQRGSAPSQVQPRPQLEPAGHTESGEG